MTAVMRLVLVLTLVVFAPKAHAQRVSSRPVELATLVVTPGLRTEMLIDVRSGPEKGKGRLDRVAGDTIFLRRLGSSAPYALSPGLTLAYSTRRTRGILPMTVGFTLGAVVGYQSAEALNFFAELLTFGASDSDYRIPMALLVGGMGAGVGYLLRGRVWHPLTLTPRP